MMKWFGLLKKKTPKKNLQDEIQEFFMIDFGDVYHSRDLRGKLIRLCNSVLEDSSNKNIPSTLKEIIFRCDLKSVTEDHTAFFVAYLNLFLIDRSLYYLTSEHFKKLDLFEILSILNFRLGLFGYGWYHHYLNPLLFHKKLQMVEEIRLILEISIVKLGEQTILRPFEEVFSGHLKYHSLLVKITESEVDKIYQDLRNLSGRAFELYMKQKDLEDARESGAI